MSGPLSHRVHYELMQRVARFSGVRRATMAVARARHGVQPAATPGLTGDDPVQSTADVDAMRTELEREGVAPRLALQPATVEAIARWAASSPCYAYENPAHGFLPADRARAEAILGRPILKAVYFNPDRHCDAMDAVCRSPVVHALAAAYLGGRARLVSRQLWWTFPTDADERTRKKVAHFYHRDIDDWAFLKFFFYVTPVQRGDGSHHFVRRSHRPGWRQLTVEGLRKTRWTDAQIGRGYGAANLLELDGPAGMGFAEDTFGLHKAQSPSVHPRLMLSLVFQLNDYHLFEQDDLERQARRLPLAARGP